MLLRLLIACGFIACTPDPKPMAEPPKKVAAVAEKAAPDFQAALSDLDRRIAFATKRSEARPKDWLPMATVADLYRERARLSGDWGDYEKAASWLERGFSVAPEGSGPFRSRASLNYTLHRLDEAEADLARAEKMLMPGQRAELIPSRADIALQRGQYDEALAARQALLRSERSYASLVGLASVLVQVGEYDQADALFAEALERYHGTSPEPRAWIHLQRGLLDLSRGRYAEAGDHYQEANAAMPGWWLVEEHQAEILALTGDKEAALRIYRDVVERTQSPELMGALAGVLAELGQEEESKQWLEKAGARWAELTQRFPEAATGHAIEHALEHNTDPKATLALAEADAKRRPGGGPLTLLARAQLAAGDLPAATATIDRVLQSRYRSANAFAAAVEIYTAAGRSAEAEQARAQAVAIDPTIL